MRMGYMVGTYREKMVIGLRLQHLSRSPEVRSHVLARLEAGEDPFDIANSIDLSNGDPNGIKINIREDKRKDFVEVLDKLLPGDLVDGKTAGQRYKQEQDKLVERNKDHTGNRREILKWWQNLPNQPALQQEIRDVLVEALKDADGNDGFEVEWDCNLQSTDPKARKVEYVEEDGVPKVLFRTAHIYDDAGGPLTEKKTARTPKDTD